MIELVFVIVVIGIITAMMLPRIDRDNVYEAAQQVISHIRYTQHLAMIDNRYDDTNLNWYNERWQIAFTQCAAGGQKVMYSIYSDRSPGAGSVLPARAEAAVDPLSKRPLFHNNCAPVAGTDEESVDLEGRYNISLLDVTGCVDAAGNTAQQVGFDTMGRPFLNVSTAVSSVDGYLLAACDIVLSVDNDSNVTIRIEPETGYAHIQNIN